MALQRRATSRKASSLALFSRICTRVTPPLQAASTASSRVGVLMSFWSVTR